MTNKSSSKQFLFYPIDLCQLNNVGINTDDRRQFNRTSDTNTKVSDQGHVEQVEGSESYWKLITERRQQAIEEITMENQQLHTLIDDLSKENDKLRVIAHRNDYLQNLLESIK